MASRNAANKSTNSKKSQANNRKAKSQAPASRNNRQQKGGKLGTEEGLSRTATEIIGVVVAVVAVALFVAVIVPSNALVAHAASWFLFTLFGLGAYLVPIALFIWAVTFFVQKGEGRHARLALGITLIVVAVLAIIASFTPDASVMPDLVFADGILQERGGYLGAGIAWCLLKLFGLIISVIILVGLIVVGAIVIGFSITSVVQRSQNALRSAREQRAEEGRGFFGSRRGQYFDEEEADDEAFTRRLNNGDAKTRNRNRSWEEESWREDEPAYGEDEFEDAPTQYIDEPASPKRKPTKRKKSPAAVSVAEDDFASQKTQVINEKDAKEDATVVIPGKGNDKVGKQPSAGEFKLPDVKLLNKTPASERRSNGKNVQADLRMMAEDLEDALQSFHLNAQVVKWVAGPTFTQFHVKLPSGVKVSRIMSLQDDIALALAAESVRIFAPVPGTSYVGIELPNPKRSNVLLGDVFGDIKGGPLSFAIGRNVEGGTVTADLAQMPHLLIAGTTGSGKSVAINTMLMSILMRTTPAQVRMILVDPKRVELSPYNGIPHLYVPVVSDTKEVVSALTWATIEMDRRYKVFQDTGTRKIQTYNSLVQAGRLDDAEEMPYIVIVIDELSDLMMTAGKEVESAIVRLAQLARAAGIHLVVATQRPASNVVTGAMKANITNRMACKVATSVDSRVILDQSGAEKLIGRGDMLFLSGDAAEPERIQGCFVSDDETQALVDYLKSCGEPEYNNDILNQATVISTGSSNATADGGDDDDPMLWEAAEIVVNSQMGSTSNIQRRLRVGYARAGRIMDQLETHGIVGPPDGSRPREVLVSDVMELEGLKALEAHDGEMEA